MGAFGLVDLVWCIILTRFALVSHHSGIERRCMSPHELLIKCLAQTNKTWIVMNGSIQNRKQKRMKNALLIDDMSDCESVLNIFKSCACMYKCDKWNSLPTKKTIGCWLLVLFSAQKMNSQIAINCLHKLKTQLSLVDMMQCVLCSFLFCFVEFEIHSAHDVLRVTKWCATKT